VCEQGLAAPCGVRLDWAAVAIAADVRSGPGGPGGARPDSDVFGFRGLSPRRGASPLELGGKKAASPALANTGGWRRIGTNGIWHAAGVGRRGCRQGRGALLCMVNILFAQRGLLHVLRTRQLHSRQHPHTTTLTAKMGQLHLRLASSAMIVAGRQHS
jgi:hypothetical protein